MNKRILFIILGFLGISLTLLFFVFIRGGAPAPSPTISPTPSLSPELETEKILQENYAQERERFFQEKPWALKLPLKSSNYFISYDPEQNEFLATIYFTTASEMPIEEQLNQSKQDALNAMRNVGIIVEQEKVIFFETEKK